MPEHKNITGADNHEPKGVESASAGTVYVANGTGSGSWQSPLSSILNLNKYALSGRITDVSVAGSSFFTSVPFKSSLTRLYAVLSGAIATANTTLTLYKNGTPQSQTVTVAYVGSAAGVQTVFNFSPAISFNEGDVLEVRAGGGSTNSVSCFVSLALTVVP